MTALEVADAVLGGVVAWYSTVHTPPESLPAVFAECHRVLAPGGHMLLAFKVGDQRLHRDRMYGHDTSLNIYLDAAGADRRTDGRGRPRRGRPDGPRTRREREAPAGPAGLLPRPQAPGTVTPDPRGTGRTSVGTRRTEHRPDGRRVRAAGVWCGPWVADLRSRSAERLVRAFPQVIMGGVTRARRPRATLGLREGGPRARGPGLLSGARHPREVSAWPVGSARRKQEGEQDDR